MYKRQGENARIHPDVQFDQYDLITIGDHVTLDKCVIRPMGLDAGVMFFSQITIGNNCSIGIKSIIAPGACVQANTHLGPLSSSYEVDECSDVKNKKYNRMNIPQPSPTILYLLGYPLLYFCVALSYIPWLLVVREICITSVNENWNMTDMDTVSDVIDWWTRPHRVAFFYVSCVAKLCVAPVIQLFLLIIVKRNILGKFKECSEAEFMSDWNRFRYWYMSKSLPNAMKAVKCTGTHYNCISWIYRALGAKVGEGIYWPGSGLDIIEFDLLEVGDDVVFGSRSVILTSTTSYSKRVQIEAGCMVADRCVLLPGVCVRRGSVLGSGCLGCENTDYGGGSVYVGSVANAPVQVSGVDLSYATKENTRSPFGIAFYDRKATGYFVVPQSMILLGSTFWACVCAIYSRMGVITSIFILKYYLKISPYLFDDGILLFASCFLTCVITITVLNLLALSIDILSKWMIIGKRKPGEYSWDHSSYCQRWQLHLTIQNIRRYGLHDSCLLDLFQGTYYLVLYFKCLGGTIGEDVCLYPNGGDPMMTEPDLVQIGNYVSVDDASLIAHFNTRGRFR